MAGVHRSCVCVWVVQTLIRTEVTLLFYPHRMENKADIVLSLTSITVIIQEAKVTMGVGLNSITVCRCLSNILLVKSLKNLLKDAQIICVLFHQFVKLEQMFRKSVVM